MTLKTETVIPPSMSSLHEATFPALIHADQSDVDSIDDNDEDYQPSTSTSSGDDNQVADQGSDVYTNGSRSQLGMLIACMSILYIPEYEYLVYTISLTLLTRVTICCWFHVHQLM